MPKVELKKRFKLSEATIPEIEGQIEILKIEISGLQAANDTSDKQAEIAEMEARIAELKAQKIN